MKISNPETLVNPIQFMFIWKKDKLKVNSNQQYLMINILVLTHKKKKVSPNLILIPPETVMR
jgi:hypothetical protein